MEGSRTKGIKIANPTNMPAERSTWAEILIRNESGVVPAKEELLYQMAVKTRLRLIFSSKSDR